MAISEPSNENTSNQKNDMKLLKSEVASFASFLGLSSSSLPSSSSGFNDADFRNSGPIKKPKPSKQKTQFDKTLVNTQDSNNSEGSPKTQFDNSSQKTKNLKNRDKNSDKNEKQSKLEQKPKKKPVPKRPVLSLDDNNKSNSSNRAFDKYKSLPKLPLVKASLLGVWHEDAKELEKKILGERNSKLDLKMGVEAWKGVVEKKKELGERLMWQYAQDFDQSSGKTGEIKMAMASQRSGTAADKVSAFATVIGYSPVANLRSLDALLGKWIFAAFGEI